MFARQAEVTKVYAALDGGGERYNLTLSTLVTEGYSDKVTLLRTQEGPGFGGKFTSGFKEMHLPLLWSKPKSSSPAPLNRGSADNRGQPSSSSTKGSNKQVHLADGSFRHVTHTEL
jgi:hypothetical protein